MASYEIEWKSAAERELRNIEPKDIKRVIKAVESLADNPYPPRHRKLRGAEEDYRMRVGDYRIIYQIDTGRKIVTIYHIRHRREAYRR